MCNGADTDCDGVADDGCLTCDGWVPGDWSSLAAALGTAAAGALVCVPPGSYAGPIAFNGAAVHLLGVAGPEATIIDAQAISGGVTISAGEGPDSILQGFTVTGGASSAGAGIYVSGSDPTLIDLIVSGNQTSGDGGGIRLASGCSAALTGIRVIGNTAAGDGGGINATSYDTSVLTNVVIAGNTAGNHGGGIHISSYSTTALSNVVIADNEAAVGGGGVNLWAHSNPSFTNFIFSGNRAPTSYGGAVQGDFDCWPVFDSGVFVGNSAQVGGAMWLWGQSVAAMSRVTISDNLGSPSGIGVNGSGVNFASCNLFGNSVQSLTYPVGTDGNIAVYPDFLGLGLVGSDPLLWDLHLSASSPLVGAGGSGTDPDGSPRDIGAYSGDGADDWDRDLDGWPAWWLPGPFDAATSPGLDCDDADPSVHPGSGC